MTYNHLIVFVVYLTLLMPFTVVGKEQIIAIDGANGFVGSSLINDMIEENHLRIGCYNCPTEVFKEYNYYDGNICDQEYLTKFLASVDIYFQMAAIASVEPKNSLQEYILTNSLAPYIASRVNRSMIMVTMSTIAVCDVDQIAGMELWVEQFVRYFTAYESMISTMPQSLLKQKLGNYLVSSPPPYIKGNQYYGLSKLLLEKLLCESSKSRDGKIIIIRPALIIGDNIYKRQGSSVVKSMLDSIFVTGHVYEVWNRSNSFTPIHKLKKLMLHLATSSTKYPKYAVYDSGAVAMNQHDFAKLILNEIGDKTTNLKFIESSNFQRIVTMQYDPNLEQYYPNMTDIQQSVKDMISKYHSVGSYK